MKLCRVLGPVWATAKHPDYAGQTLLAVQPIDAHGVNCGTSFLAIDRSQAGPGDRVLVLSEGSGARQIMGADHPVAIRSVIVGVVDAVEVAP